MRILIDLQNCQRADAPATLELARQLAAKPGKHEVWIALNARYPATIAPLRLAFAPLLPRERVRVYDLPAAEHGAAAAWCESAAELIRANFLASLEPDVVYVPGAPEAAGDTKAPAVLRRLEADFAARKQSPAAVRPRLAYVSPLPPEKSGIADYSAELVPELARRYDVELIVGQAKVDDPRLSPFPLRDLAWFEQHAHEFDRVLYHFGNSHAHQHMFEMIRRHPGIVVLHDFFLSGVLDNLEREGYLPQGYLKGLYESHGYSGLLDHRHIGRHPSIWKYPLNKGVLDHAVGVIVHSDFSKELAHKWYGDGAAAGWRTVPLLRGKPGTGGDAAARSAARARLKLAPVDYLVCTFGMLSPAKLNEELLAAFLASPLAADPHCKLVFVGENEPGLYGAGLRKKMADSAAAQRIAITGFVSAGRYSDYLAACDCSVQLRSSTRGETSAAVLDCLLYGAPTIINAHGSSAALDDNMLVKLPDAFSTAELATALAQLHADGDRRSALSQRARAHMQAEHTPAHVGQLYIDAIEHLARKSNQARYRALLKSIAALPTPCAPSVADLSALAVAIALNQPASAPRQLLVDVSAVIQSDIKTGIQRVVRSVLLALIADPPPGYRIEPVFSTGGNRNYHYARQFTLGIVGETALALEDAPVELRAGDTFLGLDLFTNGTSQNEELLQSMRDRGVAIYFVVYDILPMLRPDVFPFGTEQYFGDFLRTVTKVADGLLCISRAVADELIGWIGTQKMARKAPLQIGWFHLGADIHASAPSFGLPPDAERVFAAVAARRTFLMVGTVEPRKGQGQALAAFDLLWEQGADVNLVIVGKHGWMVDKVIERITAHPENGQRLFWLPGVSDEMLLKLYATSAALLAASEGEGFGLPLIEAAQHNIPIIARELPVFREVAHEHAYYFSGLEPKALAGAVSAWLELDRAGTAPASHELPWLTWDESARQVVDAVIKQKWYREIQPDGKR